MEPYARALLQLLYCAAGAARAEVFTFATRLTRLTRALARVRAPPWRWTGPARLAPGLVRRHPDRGGARRFIDGTGGADWPAARSC